MSKELVVCDVAHICKKDCAHRVLHARNQPEGNTCDNGCVARKDKIGYDPIKPTIFSTGCLSLGEYQERIKKDKCQNKA